MVFPTSPVVGQVFSSGGRSWVWNGTTWDSPRTDNPPLAIPTGNAIINGAFEINQRVFTSTSSNVVYTFDRWKTEFSSVTATYSAQAFAVGEAPSSTVGGTNFIRVATSAATGSTYTLIRQEVEDVRSFAGQVVTLSFWAKSSTAGAKVGARMNQQFGSGGSTFVATNATTPATLTSSWGRYSFTIALPSISGKTIGAGSSLSALIMVNDSFLGTNVGAQNATIDIWGVQLEAGTVATPFRRNAPSIQAELAACQRYYWQNVVNGQSAIKLFFSNSANEIWFEMPFHVQMRAAPTCTQNVNNTTTSAVATGLAFYQAGFKPGSGSYSYDVWSSDVHHMVLRYFCTNGWGITAGTTGTVDFGSGVKFTASAEL
jgi:hypothetical protein